MRAPNPRVLVPILLAAAAGGVVGYFVTAASCAPRSCVPTAIALSLIVAIVSGIGVGVVVVLAVRSFAEWRVHTERDVLVAADPERSAERP